jgi:hypothetical protein
MRNMPVLAAAVLTVALSAPACALGSTWGSPLANPSNATFGCESVVTQDFVSGLFFMSPQGQPSCTWWTTGSGTPGETFTSYVPGTGTVTNVRVKSGPQPAPLRISILRSNGQGTFQSSGTGGCCFGQRETAVVQPQPNAVTEFAVNLPVESVRIPEQGVQYVDIVAVSAAGGTGTLPIFDAGAASHSVSTVTAGGPFASMTAPKFEPDNAPRLNFRAAPGWELLMQFDFVCAGARAHARQASCPPPAQTTTTPSTTPPATTPPATSPATATTPAPVARPGLAAKLAGGSAKLTRGRVPVRVTCAAATPCVGTLKLRTRGKRSRLLGTAQVSVAAGQARTIRAKLSSAGRRVVRAKRSTPAQAVLDLGTVGRITQNLTIRR